MIRKHTKTSTSSKLSPKAPASPPASPPKRDGAGHLDPKVSSKLKAIQRESRAGTPTDAKAFVTAARSTDAMAEQFGESVITMATSGEDDGADVRDALVQEELGGPFVKTSSKTEFARGVDASNPKGATREATPKS